MRLVFDLDGTLTTHETVDYSNAIPNTPVIEKLRQYKAQGYSIIIATSRNMRTYNSSVGHINANTLPVIIEWLKKNDIPYDEIHVGKPWCGHKGFYIDDKAIRPSEFLQLSYEEIVKLTSAPDA